MRDVLRNRWLLLILLLAAAGFAVSQSSVLQGTLSQSGRFNYFTPQESEVGITVVKGKYTVMSCAGRGTFPVFSDALRAASGSLSVLAHQYPRQKSALGTFMYSEKKMQDTPSLRATNTLTHFDRGSRYHVFSVESDLTFRCGEGLSSETVTLFPITGGLYPWEGGDFRSIDEGVEQGQHTPNDSINTRTVLFPRQVGNCIGSVCYPIGPPPEQVSLFQLSRLPSNMQDVATVRLRIVGDRGIGEWNNIVWARLINSVTKVPLTSYATLSAFPKYNATDKRMDIDLIPLPSVAVSEWTDPMLEIATNWRYCGYVTTSGSCGGNLPSTQLMIFALDAQIMLVCDGPCESVAPFCGNGILERYANEECDDGDDEDANACSNTCMPTNL